MKVEAIDLFCGIGGLTYGLRQAKISVLAGLDSDVSCAYSYEQNNNGKFIEADVSEYDFTEMNKMYSENSIRVLVGCPPCQPFSSHTFKAKNKQKDVRWNLIDYFLKAITELNPHIISMENVRGITKTGIFDKFVRKIKKMGYTVWNQGVSQLDLFFFTFNNHHLKYTILNRLFSAIFFIQFKNQAG